MTAKNHVKIWRHFKINYKLNIFLNALMFTYIAFVRIRESELAVTNLYEKETVLMEIINIGSTLCAYIF